MEIGIEVDSSVIEAYTAMKQNKTYRYITMKLTDNNKLIILDKTGETTETYDDFLKILPKNEPRYCMFDYQHTFLDSRKTNKLVYILWCPDECIVQKKMIAATNNENFKGKLPGFTYSV